MDDVTLRWVTVILTVAISTAINTALNNRHFQDLEAKLIAYLDAQIQALGIPPAIANDLKQGIRDAKDSPLSAAEKGKDTP